MLVRLRLRDPGDLRIEPTGDQHASEQHGSRDDVGHHHAPAAPRAPRQQRHDARQHQRRSCRGELVMWPRLSGIDARPEQSYTEDERNRQRQRHIVDP